MVHGVPGPAGPRLGPAVWAQEFGARGGPAGLAKAVEPVKPVEPGFEIILVPSLLEPLELHAT